jgi:hypothetical protein
VIATNPVIKKKSVLRPLSAVVVSKHRGIVIDVQGTTDDTYKIKIIGTHNNYQMSTILNFIQRFISLYYETFVMKLSSRKALTKEVEKVKSSVLIKTNGEPSVKRAARKHDADKMLTTNTNSGDAVKYTRECQNSGKEIRRPIPILSLDELKKAGYKLNKSSGVYERVIVHPQTKEKVTLVAVNIKEDGKEVYYVCDPKVHKDRLFIGALSKSQVQLPCCFKKNQLQSTNKKIKRTFEELLNGIQENEDNMEVTQGDIFYVRKLTSKTQPDRLHFLPPMLNKWLQKYTAEIKASKLISCPKGHLFVHGCDQSRGLLGICAQLIQKSEKELLRTLVTFTENMEESSFCFLVGGLIKTKYTQSSNLAKAIQKGSESVTSLLFVELTMLAFHVNVVVIECQDDKDSYVRYPTFFDADWKTCVVIIDPSLGYHIVVETVIQRNKEAVITNTMFLPNHYLAKCVKEFVLMLNSTTDTNDVNPTSYGGVDNLKGQILDSENKTIYVVAKDSGVILPTMPTRCHPFLPVLSLSDTNRHSIRNILDEYEQWEWLYPKAVITRKKQAIAVIVDVGNALLSRECIIPVLAEEIGSNTLYGLPLEKDDDTQDPYYDDDRKFQVNIEHIKDETYATLRVMLASQFQENIPLRQNIIELITENKNKRNNEIRILKLLGNLLSSHVVRGTFTLDEWINAHYQEIVNVQWDSNIRSKKPCNSRYGVGILCGRTGVMTLPREWYYEFFTKLTLQLYNMDIQGKELLLDDKYRVATIIEDRSIPRKSRNDLIVSGHNPPIKVVLRLLFGYDVESVTTTKRNGEEANEIYHLEEEQMFYTTVHEKGNDILLRALVSGLYSLIYRQQFGLRPTILGPGNALQKVLVSNVRGRITSWLLRHIDNQPPTECEVSSLITRRIIFEFTKNSKVADSWWIFTTWIFHRLFNDIPIVVFNSTPMYYYSKGSIITLKGKSDTKNLVNNTYIVIRVTLDEKKSLQKVETLYLKE